MSIITVLIILIAVVSLGTGFYGHATAWQGLGGHIGTGGLLLVAFLLLMLLFAV